MDNFDYKSPDDFAPDDFRRTCESMFPHSTPLFSMLTILIAPKFQGENFYKNLKIVEEIKALATRKGYKVSQIAIAWVASQGMIPIPGTTKASRLEENWKSRDIDFTAEEVQEMRRIIDAAKPHGNRYSAANQSLVGH